jgi:lysophospholipase L1-like esterase
MAAAVAVSAATTVTAVAAQPSFQHYVALGDSYTSGPLIPFQRLERFGCFRSTSNYPSLLAATLKPETFTDISCAGADTTNMTEPQSVVGGSNPPQLTALNEDTDLVTLGIGGNDYSVFGTIIDTCTGLRDSDPTGSPCKDKFTVDGVDTMLAKMPDIQRNVTAALAGIHQRAPKAKVLILGYPEIAPKSGYCPDKLPLADGDYPWADAIEQGLNGAVEGAARADGNASYVDTYTPSAGHDICATGGAAWINGKDNDFFAAAAYHPFKSAMVAEASLVNKSLGGSSPTATMGTVTGPTASTGQLKQLLARH